MLLWLNIIQELRLYQFDFDYLAWFGLQGHNMCVYVCMYICMYVHICVYIFCTYVYLYLIVYNWFKRGHFNIFLIYFELGKHVCIFLYSFILWQIDAYWLWALSKGTVTFIEGYLVDWVIPEKNPNRGTHQGLEDIFEKTLGFLSLSLYLWTLWIPEKKRANPRKICKIMVHSFFGL